MMVLMEIIDTNAKAATLSFGLMFIMVVAGLILFDANMIMSGYCFGVASAALAYGIIHQQIAATGIETMNRSAKGE